MPGISCKFPLSFDDIDGAYRLNKELVEVVRQNLKMLLLTNPGERCMDTDFGIGIERFLFENDTPALRESMSTRIHNQVNKYMPFITIQDVFQGPSDDLRTIGPNSFHISLHYHIEPIARDDILNVSLPKTDKF